MCSGVSSGGCVETQASWLWAHVIHTSPYGLISQRNLLSGATSPFLTLLPSSPWGLLWSPRLEAHPP